MSVRGYPPRSQHRPGIQQAPSTTLRRGVRNHGGPLQNQLVSRCCRSISSSRLTSNRSGTVTGPGLRTPPGRPRTHAVCSLGGVARRPHGAVSGSCAFFDRVLLELFTGTQGGPSRAATISSGRSGDSSRRGPPSSSRPVCPRRAALRAGLLVRHLPSSGGKMMSAPSSARTLQIAAPIPSTGPRRSPPPSARRPAAIYLVQDPRVFHDTPAGDVDQAAAGRGDAGHGAGHDLDGLRVRYED